MLADVSQISKITRRDGGFKTFWCRKRLGNQTRRPVIIHIRLQTWQAPTSRGSRWKIENEVEEEGRFSPLKKFSLLDFSAVIWLGGKISADFGLIELLSLFLPRVGCQCQCNRIIQEHKIDYYLRVRLTSYTGRSQFERSIDVSVSVIK